MPVEPQARIGEVFESKYQIEELLGTGAMGTVFRARHVAIGREVAVKLLHPRLLKDSKLIRRFEREAELAGKLSHPNVVSVVDVGTHDGVSFLVMDLAQGDVLTALLTKAPFPPERAIPLIRQICAGLDHAHEHGLIHRDLKPDNIIVDPDGTARIVDFGIALLREGSGAPGGERLTTGGIVLGTPHYMAPELAMGSAIDHRIDLFALGVICFQMLTGRMPFAGDGVTVAMANITAPTPKMGIDPLLEAFTHKLMAKDPAKRPATAGAARDLIDRIEHDRAAAADMLGVKDTGPTPSGELPPIPTMAIGSASTAALGTAPTVAITTSSLVPPRRHWRLVLAIAIAAALGVGGAIAYALHRARAEAPSLSPTSQPESVDEPRSRLPATEPAPPAAEAPTSAPRVRPTQPATPAPAITADSVARHYGAVGRKLKALTDRGVDAKDLWERYHTIKIMTVTPDQLAPTEALLGDLDAAITRR